MIRLRRERRQTDASKDVAALEREIDRLSERNRRRRDPEVARRLVQLRSEAFRRQELPAAPSPWPDGVEDRFPGELVPEVHRQELTVHDIRSAIAHHGSLHVRAFVGADHVDRLVADIDRALRAFDAHAAGAPPGQLAGWHHPFDHPLITDANRRSKRSKGSVLAVDSPPALFDVIEAMRDAGVPALATDYFGESPALLARKVTLRRVAHDFGGPFHTGWHQDGAFMGAGTRSLNVWLALSHCGDDAPGLDVVGRRFDGLLPTGNGAYAEWGIKAEHAVAAAGGAIVRPVFEPGDALLFDHLCLHRTAADAGMTKDRYAVETWFMAPSTYGAMTQHQTDGYSPRDQVPLAF